MQHRDKQLQRTYDECAYCGKLAIPKTKWKPSEKISRGHHPTIGQYLQCQSCGRTSIKSSFPE